MIRLRPRFSLRTLAFVVTLACAYFAAWEATKRYALPKHFLVYGGFTDTYSPLPFVVRADEEVMVLNGSPVMRTNHYYYFWLLGPMVKLPFESVTLPTREQVDGQLLDAIKRSMRNIRARVGPTNDEDAAKFRLERDAALATESQRAISASSP